MIAMVQTGALLGPLVWLVRPKVELYEDAGDSFSWHLVKIELLHDHRLASNRGMESRYGCLIKLDGG